MSKDTRQVALRVVVFAWLTVLWLPRSHADTTDAVTQTPVGNSTVTRYRYRLEGIDSNWRESVDLPWPDANVTLPAGTYQLQVQIAADGGTWHAPGISLAIRVLPPWWANSWVRALGVLLLIALGWWIIRTRVRYATRQVTLQMEARNNERMRIAGDLHDTLLQGLLSASYQLSVVSDQLAPDARARPLLDHVSDLLRQLAAEGRNAVRGLRTRNFDPDDFEGAIATIASDVQIESRAQFSMAIEGKPRALRPVARSEAYLIAREAISNALRHADAASVEVHLQYLPDRFWLTVRDDGRGFVAGPLASKHSNHFGLAVMSERAERLHGVLTVSSRAGAGTEVVLSAPGREVYQPETSRKPARVVYE
jgi:signal transduction histidine kinase